MNTPKIVAEIGCRITKVTLAIAKEMIMTAATYCKRMWSSFKSCCNTELLTSEEYNAPILIRKILMVKLMVNIVNS